MKNELSPSATIHYVVISAFKINSNRSWHG
jgi:hypothetical protein